MPEGQMFYLIRCSINEVPSEKALNAFAGGTILMSMILNLYFDLKSLGGNTVPVRARSPAPNSRNPNQILQIGDGFGFLLFFSYGFFSNGAPVQKESKPRGPRKKKKYDDSS